MDFPRTAGEVLAAASIPWRARREAVRDLLLGPPHRRDPGALAVARACAAWLSVAQDQSRSQDGGVARHYSLLDGWAESYAETTGYIVPTMLEWARVSGDYEFRDRARRMLDWLISLQFPAGGFPGGTVSQQPRVPVTFNTGQILLGLAAGAHDWPEYIDPLQRAAEWLCATQDPDGGWRRNPTPFARHDDKAYETHVAWALLEAARITSESRFAEHGLANIRWALRQQASNGWFANCCLDDPSKPLTHTIGYVLRGVIEGFRYSGDPMLLDAAVRCADGVLTALPASGALPGRLDRDWRGSPRWCCLTGNAQIAHCWLLLAECCDRPHYRTAADCALGYVRRTVRLDGSDAIRGGVKGAFPVNGGYGWWEYLSWAAKFLIDASLLQEGEPVCLDAACRATPKATVS